MEQYNIYTIFSFNLTINQIVFYLFITNIIIFLLFNLNDNYILSNNQTILNETLYRTILNIVENYLTIKNLKYFPFIFTLFHFILFSNLLGMIPYSTTSTVELIITLFISFTFLMGILLLGFLNKNFYLFAVFIPAGTPFGLIILMIVLEILAYLTRLFSLGLRLSINMITGHILTKVCLNFIQLGYLANVSLFILFLPLLLLTFFLALELLIAYLQAYIFTFIICITFRDMI